MTKYTLFYVKRIDLEGASNGKFKNIRVWKFLKAASKAKALIQAEQLLPTLPGARRIIGVWKTKSS